MTLRLSSGLRDAVITNHGLGSLINGGYIQVFSGEQPETADMPPTGTLLATITQEGLPIPIPGSDEGGLMVQLGPAVGELVSLGTWRLRGLAAGDPGWWRFVGSGPDNGAYSSTLCRIDGAATDSIVPALAPITAATDIAMGGFSLSFPY